MGLHVEILSKARESKYLGPCDCTAGGASVQNIDGFTVCKVVDLEGNTIREIEGPFEPCEEYPEAVVIYREYLDYYHVEPVQQYHNNEPVEAKCMQMAGGNFVTTCDSRFKFNYPLPIHDRID